MGEASYGFALSTQQPGEEVAPRDADLETTRKGAGPAQAGPAFLLDLLTGTSTTHELDIIVILTYDNNVFDSDRELLAADRIGLSKFSSH